MRVVTNSEFQTFKDCRRRWWLSWHRRLRPIRTEMTGAAPLGSSVHAAIEVSYRRGINTSDAWTELVEWQTAELEGVLPEDVEKQNELVRIMLSGFDDWRTEVGLDAGYRVLAVEQKIEAELTGGVLLMGKLDQIVERDLDGEVLLQDVKTVGTIEDGGIRQNAQFRTYALILRLLGHRANGARRVMLRKVKRTARAKPPFYGVDTAQWTDAQLSLFRNQLIGQIADMVAVETALDSGGDPGRLAYPHFTSECSWKCDFAGVCPMFDDPGDDAEGMLRMLYEQGNPLDRYQDVSNED